jgi:hypothetical protein
MIAGLAIIRRPQSGNQLARVWLILRIPRIATAPAMDRFKCQLVAAVLPFAAALLVGCGTTRSTDTARTASEQLLISDAIDRAVQSVDLKTLAGQKVFLDDSRLGDVIDRNYLISTLRQHLLANGCQLRDTRDQADFVVEARAGAVGTDRNDLLFGVPSMNVPQVFPLQPVPGAVIPEIPIAKRRDQKGIAKIAVFAYHRETGTPVWQSGLVHQESSSNDVWILGAGPFQRGSIYDGTAFAGKQLGADEKKGEAILRRLPSTELARESTFTSPKQLTKAPEPPPTPTQPPTPAVAQPVVQASHQETQATPASTTEAKTAEAAPMPAADGQSSQAEPKTAAAVVGQPTSKPQSSKSVYAPAGTAQLPQPRFGSP